MTVTKKDLDSVIEWTTRYFYDCGAKKAIVGLSGGIDSAVIASICVKAIGKENVIGLIMPCQSQYKDEKLAYKLAHNLGINGWAKGQEKPYIDNTFQMDLEKTFNQFWKDYRYNINPEYDCVPDTYSKLVPANIKARLRMTTLYAVAGHVNGLVVGTTNKTEALLGYVTKYGDGGVDIEPIQDFYKAEVYELAALLEDIPEAIIKRAPTAGNGQTDEDELEMTYANIDAYLKAKEKGKEVAVLSKIKEEKLLKLIASNKHKDLGLPHYERG